MVTNHRSGDGFGDRIGDSQHICLMLINTQNFSRTKSILFFLIGGFFLKLHLGWFFGVTLMFIHLYFQSTKINKINRDLSLKVFHSNKIAGLFLVLGSFSKFLDF